MTLERMDNVLIVVDDIETVLARLVDQGAALLGEVVQYGDAYKLCYLRGPEGIVVALAEELG